MSDAAVSAPEYVALKAMVMALIAGKAATLNATDNNGGEWLAAFRLAVIQALSNAEVSTGGIPNMTLQREAIAHVDRILAGIHF